MLYGLKSIDMENENQSHEEEAVNPEQFQDSRKPGKGQSEDNQDNRNDKDEADYTPGETEFADGKGTRLDQESEEVETDEQQRDLDHQDTD